MRKAVLTFVLMVVGFGCFASTKAVSVFDSDGKHLLTTQEEDNEALKVVQFYDTDEDFIEVELYSDGCFYIYVNGLASRSIGIGPNEVREQWDKYSKLAHNETTDDNGNVESSLVLFAKDGYIYVVSVYPD